MSSVVCVPAGMSDFISQSEMYHGFSIYFKSRQPEHTISKGNVLPTKDCTDGGCELIDNHIEHRRGLPCPTLPSNWRCDKGPKARVFEAHTIGRREGLLILRNELSMC